MKDQVTMTIAHIEQTTGVGTAQAQGIGTINIAGAILDLLPNDKVIAEGTWDSNGPTDLRFVVDRIVNRQRPNREDPDADNPGYSLIAEAMKVAEEAGGLPTPYQPTQEETQRYLNKVLPGVMEAMKQTDEQLTRLRTAFETKAGYKAALQSIIDGINGMAWLAGHNLIDAQEGRNAQWAIIEALRSFERSE